MLWWQPTDAEIWQLKRQIIATVIVAVLVTLALGVIIGRALAAPELTGSRVITLERADDGEIFAALSVVLDLEFAPGWSAVLVHDQTATWRPEWEMIDRRVEWDASLAWRPAPGWSVSLGRRWRVGPPPDYGGPWTYVQVWRGF